MNPRLSEYRGVPVVAPLSRFSYRDTDAFKLAVQQVLASGASCLVVDLGGVGRMDSAGVGALLAVKRRAAEQGTALRVVCPDPEVRHVFELTRTHEILDIFDSLDEAVDDVLAAGEAQS